MDIERIATSEIEQIISKTELLTAHIASGDRSPSFDGYICLHEDSSHSKKNIKQINVQVKGKSSDLHKAPNTISYPVSTIDLNNFRTNGGCLFFVVLINSKNHNVLDTYYSSLLPFKIDELYKSKISKQKTISCEFKLFPHNEKAITELIMDFSVDSGMQYSFSSPIYPQDSVLESSPALESISFHCADLSSAPSPAHIPKLLSNKELFLYGSFKNSPAKVPIKYISSIQDTTIEHTFQKAVTVGGKKYYDSYKVVCSKDTQKCIFGNSTYIEYPNVDRPENCKFSFSISGTLNQRLTDTLFIIAISKNAAFEIDGNVISLAITNEILCKDTVERLEKYYKQISEIKTLFNKLGVKKDLDLDSCAEKDFKNLFFLTEAILYKKPLAIAKRLELVSFYNVCNINLALLAIEQKEGTYRLYDFFKKNIPVSVFDSLKKAHSITQFALLNKDSYLKADNINYSRIRNGFESIEKYDEFNLFRINESLLEMIKAYDENSDNELYETMTAVSKIILKNKKVFNGDIALMNMYQILKRKRALTIDEKSKLWKMLDTTNEAKIKAGIMILLEEYDNARQIINNMECESADEFRSFPIYNLLTKGETKK